MKKKWLLLCGLIMSITMCSCQIKEPPVYMIPYDDKETEQQLVSLIGDEECQNVVCFEKNNIVSAVVSERKTEITPDNTVNGEETFYIVIYDKQKEEMLLVEKKVAEQGFQASFLQQQDRIYVSVISRNDYCGVEYYDMGVYRVEDGKVSAGEIAEDDNSIQWWQDYKSVLTSDGLLELYVRKTETDSFTNELSKEMGLLHWDKVDTGDYAEKFAYTWELVKTLRITELDYLQGKRMLTQSQVFADIVEQCFKPYGTETSGDRDKLCGIVCATVGEECGCQLIVCKRLGSSLAQGIGHLAIMLYDKQGELVDFDYQLGDNVSVDYTSSEVHVFVGWNQQGFVETVMDGIVFEEEGDKIGFEGYLHNQ